MSERHVLGSAISLESVVSVTSGTTMTLYKLIDPNGTTILSDESMSLVYDSDENEYYYRYIWQTTSASTAGRYKFLTKAVNGIYTDIAKSYLFLDPE